MLGLVHTSVMRTMPCNSLFLLEGCFRTQCYQMTDLLILNKLFHVGWLMIVYQDPQINLMPTDYHCSPSSNVGSSLSFVAVFFLNPLECLSFIRETSKRV